MIGGVHLENTQQVALEAEKANTEAATEAKITAQTALVDVQVHPSSQMIL